LPKPQACLVTVRFPFAIITRFMVDFNKDTSADFEELDPRINAAVSNVHNKVDQNIAWQRTWFRSEMLNALARRFDLYPNATMRAGGRLRKEAKLQHADLPSSERSDAMLHEGLHRAAVLSANEERLHQDTNYTLPQFINIPAKATDKAGQSVDVVFTIETPYGAFGKEELSEEKVVTEIQGGHPFGRGHTRLKFWRKPVRSSIPLAPITRSEAEEIARTYIRTVSTYRDLPKQFASNGVSEMNVQTALVMAKQDPQAVLGLFGKSTEETEREIHQLKSKVQLVASLEALGQLSMESHEIGFGEIGDEIARITSDLRDLKAGAATFGQSKVGKKLKEQGYSETDPADKPEMRKRLVDGQESLSKAQRYYDKIKSAMERVAHNARSSDVPLGSSEKYFDATTDHVKPSELRKELDPKIVADDMLKEFGLKSKEDLKKDIEAKEKEAKDIKDGKKAMSGSDAVLATYQKHFESKEGGKLAPTEARRAAAELYARNSVGRQEMLLAKKTLDNPKIFKEPEGFLEEWTVQQARELWNGSQEAMVCHMAESPAIGMQKGAGGKHIGPLGIFRGTNRLGFLWRKHNARPAWGSLEYPAVITAFYGLKKLVKDGELHNTAYVRAQRDELMRLLMTKFTKNLVKDFDLQEQPEEVKKEVDALSQQHLQQNIRLALAGDAPSAYVTDVTEAAEFAKAKTGRIRKAGRKAVATTFQYAVKKPVVWLATEPAKFLGRSLRKFWQWGTTKTSPLFK